MTAGLTLPRSFDRPSKKWWPSSAGAAPLFATRRNPAAYTDGPGVGAIARSLGTPLIPWQQYVADVANERRGDGSYEYQVVVVTVPRQSGKTTLVRANGVHTCVVCGRDVFYTAQTGKDARARWMDLVKVLRSDPMWNTRADVALRGGSEHVTFPGGAVFQVFAPTPESLHGYTPPKVKCDEVFSWSPTTGELIMGAIEPAQFTIVDKQIWLVSTMGTAESTFFHDWVDRAIDGMARVAAFYWGAGDDHDPYDPDHIADFHPAVGFQLGSKTITPYDVLAASEGEKLTRAEYERAYGNRRTVTVAALIPPDVWRELGPLLDDTGEPLNPLQLPDDWSDVALTYDVAVDRQSASINATWHDERTDRIATKVVAAQPGASWLPDTVAQLERAKRPAVVSAAGHGPVVSATTQLVDDHGLEIQDLREREFAAATGAFLTRIDDRTLIHDGSLALERSVTGLVTRSAGADGIAFSRRHSIGDSSPAIATVTGVWATERRLGEGKPLLDFAS